ncbi:MAG: hypothetical protein ACKVY0_02540 [Prosthecobacter sp.]|uniref:hypothetical protein n=1 Tax=Prosthecobacter sp. TaxID=1965333 RepID=UPI0038FF76C3
MTKKAIANLPVRETSQFMREMWAAEAEHPVFAGSLLNLRFMAAGAGSSKTRPPAKARKKTRATAR